MRFGMLTCGARSLLLKRKGWCLSLTLTRVVTGTAISLRGQLEDHAEHAVQFRLTVTFSSRDAYKFRTQLSPAMVVNLHIGSLTGLSVRGVPSSVGTVWPSGPRRWLQVV